AVRQENGKSGSRGDMSVTTRSDRLLYEGADWEFGTIQRAYEAVERIALEELGLDVYPNQVDIDIDARLFVIEKRSGARPLGAALLSDAELLRRQRSNGLVGLAMVVLIPNLRHINDKQKMVRGRAKSNINSSKFDRSAIHGSRSATHRRPHSRGSVLATSRCTGSVLKVGRTGCKVSARRLPLTAYRPGTRDGLTQ